MTLSVGHLHRNPTVQDFASVSVGGVAAALVGASVPPTGLAEAASVSSAVATIWQLPVASLDLQHQTASVQLLCLADPTASVQLLNLSVGSQIPFLGRPAESTAPVQLEHLPVYRQTPDPDAA